MGSSTCCDRQPPNPFKDIILRRWKLCLVASDAFEFFLNSLCDVHGDGVLDPRRWSWLERQTKIELPIDGVNGERIEIIIPLGKPRVKDCGVGYLHRLVMVG